jgi:HD-GYP domain-containing protein (c-di-GMP phosphodiesterase class II)
MDSLISSKVIPLPRLPLEGPEGPAPGRGTPSRPTVRPESPSGPAPFLKASIQSLLRTLAARDPYTAHHSTRVTEVAVWFARHLNLAHMEVASLKNAAFLHDIGKIGISDAILLKPGPLTPEERALITTHPLIGEKIVEPLKLSKAEREIILLHHERWDGQGYPRGLAGQNIPLLCRVTALADVFDALTSDRPYRRRFTLGEALAEIKAQAGSQFDPELAHRFVQLMSSCPPRCSVYVHLPRHPMLDLA